MKRIGEFEELQSMLEACDADMGAAETHGLASGMLSVQFDADFNRWLTAIFDTEAQLQAVTDDDKQSLTALFYGTLELLKDESFEFDLLLPGDDGRISERAKALSEWCQGFLYGVAYMGVGDDAKWGEEGRGILRDMMEISRLDADGSEDADEQSFIELHEYVRAAVHVLMGELQAPDEDTTPEPTVH